MKSNRSDRYFFGALGVWFLVVTMVGFSPTFYLRPPGNSLASYIVVHGALATVWVLFFTLQAGLISARQRKLHRVLGLLSLPLCLAVVATGTLVAFRAVAWRADGILGTALNVATMVALVVLVALGVFDRQRPDRHKRFMATALMIFVSPAVSRWGHNGLIPEAAVFLLVLLPWFAMLAYDFLSRGSFHRVTLISKPAALALHLVAGLAAGTAPVEKLIRQIALSVS